MPVEGELSFLPDEYLSRKANWRAMRLAAPMMTVAAIAMACALVGSQRTLRRAESRHAEAVNQYNRAAQSLEQASRVAEEQRKVLRYGQLVASLVEGVPRSTILASVVNALPEGITLLSMSLESSAHRDAVPTSLTAFDMRKAAILARHATDASVTPTAMDVTLKISGLAATDVQVAELMNNLGRAALFQDVRLLVSDGYVLPSNKSSRCRRFQLQMTLTSTPAASPAPGPLRLAAMGSTQGEELP